MLGIDVPAESSAMPGGIVGLRYASRGETDVFPTFHDPTAMPFDGYYIQSSDRNGLVMQSGPTSAPCNEGDPGAIPGYIELSWYWNDCNVGYGQPYVPLTGHGYVLNPFQNAIQDFAGQHVDATSPGVSDPGQAAVQQNIKATIEAGTTPHLRDWLDREFARFATVPNCSGQTQTACGTLLDQAGLSSRIQVLSFDTADVTLPPDAVVNSDPAPGVTVLKSQQVTLSVNPDAAHMPRIVPAPSATETAAHYIDRIHALNLLAAPVYAPANDPTKPEDQTTGVTTPAVGTRVHQGSGVYVNAVNEPALDEIPGEDPARAPVIAATEDRQECDLSTPTLTNQNNGTFDRYDPFVGDPFRGIAPVPPGPEFVAPQEASAMTTLRWGRVDFPPPGASKYDWVGWGWLKISAKHGWATADAEATRTTLIQGTHYTDPESGYNVYRASASADYFGRTGQPCVRVVVIDPNANPRDTYRGQPAPAAGVITSFGELTKFPLA